MPDNRIAILHSTCCYFNDTIHLNSLLDRIFTEEGYEVYHIFTDGYFCTYFYQLNFNKKKCTEIHQKSFNFLLQRKNLILLKDYTYRNIEQQINLDSSIIKRQTYNGLNLWELIEASVSANLEVDNIEGCFDSINISKKQLINSFMNQAKIYIDAFSKIFDDYSPNYIILFNGLFYLERIAYEIGRRKGINIIVTESSCFANRKYFALNIKLPERLYTKEKENSFSSDYDGNKLKSYFEGVFSGKNNFIKQSNRKVDVTKYLSIPENVIIGTFFSQIPYDSVLIYGKKVFPSILDAISSTIKFISEYENVFIIIRLHPDGVPNTGDRKDVIYDSLSQIAIPPNVRIVRLKELNTYDIMKISDFGITVSSQSGLEFLSMHKPLLTLGFPFYSGYGLTFDIENEADYFDKLKQIILNPKIEQSRIEKIDRFLYYFIFNYLIPIDRNKSLVTDEGIQKILKLLGSHQK